jgi:hypothetical protein
VANLTDTLAMKKLIGILFVVCLCAFDGPKMTKVKLTDKVTAMVPVTFRVMSDDEIAARYFTYRKPAAMLTDMRGVVDFGVNISTTNWRYDDLELLQKFYRASISQMFSETEFIREEIVSINNRRYIVFEFLSEIRSAPTDAVKRAPKAAYSYLMYTVTDDYNLYVFNFSCPLPYRQEWSSTAQAIMESIRFTK